MAYPILDPSRSDPALQSKCALAVMAKAPRAGRVKTRLSPPLTLAQTAALNICFLQDTTRNIADIAAAGSASGLVCYTPIGEEALFDGLLPEGFAMIAQRGDDFGERLLGAAEDILACGFGSVCLIDSDSPTVPARAYRQAIEALGHAGDRIVIGGSSDGGYYLIGLKQAHPMPFTNIHWSTSTVYGETVSAIAAANIELVTLPAWYDVDDEDTLNLLRSELIDGMPVPLGETPGYDAAHSRRFLNDLFGGCK